MFECGPPPSRKSAHVTSQMTPIPCRKINGSNVSRDFYSLAIQRQKFTFLYQFNVKLCLDSQYLKKGASTLRQPLHISTVFVYIA